MVKDDDLTVKGFDHIPDPVKNLIIAGRAEVIKGKDFTCTNRCQFPLLQVFLSLLQPDILDMETLVSLNSHDMEAGLPLVLLKGKDTDVHISSLDQMMCNLPCQCTLTNATACCDSDKFTCPESIEHIIETFPRIGIGVLL